ncbi:unnamed protein product [Heligmosomoides polygyrus]|uniref:Uncharacterized protein n=1 Tax=Heligmosomoides polygyrus TaxID=6339 RepID=A0A183GXE0_HELPZ|nr:unnamed protein product [Heligmosomoides polygyrus]
MDGRRPQSPGPATNDWRRRFVCVCIALEPSLGRQSKANEQPINDDEVAHSETSEGTGRIARLRRSGFRTSTEGQMCYGSNDVDE